jgi:5-methylcytosine-specific restriction endonuclease McrA
MNKDVTNTWKDAVLAHSKCNNNKYARGRGADKEEEKTCPDKLRYNKYEKNTPFTTDNCLRRLGRY